MSRAALILITIIALVPATLDVVSQDLILDQDNIPLVHRLGDDDDTYLTTISLLAKVRSRNALNHLAMATIYRTSFDRVRDPDARRSLGIAAALEYQRGLELNPWHGQARPYYADFLEQNPWLMRIAEIEATPESLYRQGAALFPSVVAPHLRLAVYLRRTGRADAAYELLVEHALPWAGHRFGNWQDPRVELFERVYAGALRRGDEAALRRLLGHLDKLRG